MPTRPSGPHDARSARAGTRWSASTAGSAAAGGSCPRSPRASAPAGLLAAAAEAARLLDEDGVTYRPLGAPEEQTWGLDPLPVFVDEAEWAVLEPGLIQRSRCSRRCCTTCTARAIALRSGALPNEIVHGHPGFLRAWDGVAGGTARQLFLAAADLARGQDGAWCVIADRVQAPPGAGYAMANRRVVSRVLPAPAPRSPRSTGSARSSTRCGSAWSRSPRPPRRPRAPCC